MADSIWTRADHHILEVLVGLTVVALVIAPLFTASSVGVWAMLVSAVVVALVRYRAAAPITKDTWTLIGVGALAIGLVVATSLLAQDVTHSFFGKPGQRAGAITWVGMLLLFVVLVVRARPGDLGRVLRAVALASGVMAIAALVDSAGLIEVWRFSEEAAGLLESSISLGEVLALGAGCAAAWALSSRDAVQQALGWATVAIVVIAMLAADARAGLVALAAAVAIVAVARLAGPRTNTAMRAWGVALAAVAVALIAAGWFLIGPDGLDRADQWAEFTNQRSVIWASGYGAAAQAPILGRGPDQFSAWAAWSSDPSVGLSKAGTYDPHNLLLAWFVAAGFAGLLVAGVVAAAGLGRMFVTFHQRGYALAVGAVLAALLGWSISLMFAWMAPIGAFLAVLVFASLLSAGDRAAHAPAPSRSVRYVVTGIAAAVALGLLVGSWPGSVSEYEWAQRSASGTLDAAAVVQLAEASGDPSLAALAVGTLVQEAAQNPALAASNVELAERVEPILADASTWHVDAAYAGMLLRALMLGALEQGSWDDVDAYIQAGRRADPASGLWDYVAAVQAERLGEAELAREYATAALDYPQPDSVRPYLEGLAATP
jgi:O-antigen ligase